MNGVYSFSKNINGVQILSGGENRVHAIEFFLQTALFLEPINIFLYTWRFLQTLEAEERNQLIKAIYRWVAIITISLIPISFYCVYAALVIADMKSWNSVKGDNIYYKLQPTIGYLALTSNLFACIVLLLVLRLVK